MTKIIFKVPVIVTEKMKVAKSCRSMVGLDVGWHIFLGIGSSDLNSMVF